MLTFAPNLSTLFTEVPFIDRFAKAKEAGFKHVEFQFPYENSAHDIKEKARKYKLQTVLFNLPAGNWREGDRGIAIFENRREEFRESVLTAIEYAHALNC